MRAPSRWHAYLFAIAAAALATVLRLAEQAWRGDALPFLLFFLAVVAASGYGGFGPGVVASSMSAIGAYVVLSPERLGVLGAVDVEGVVDVEGGAVVGHGGVLQSLQLMAVLVQVLRILVND